MSVSGSPSKSQSLKDQGKSRTHDCGNGRVRIQSQSLKDQGKSRTSSMVTTRGSFPWSQSLKDQGKSRTNRHLCRVRENLSQSLKDQGKSRTKEVQSFKAGMNSRNPLKIRASLGPRQEISSSPIRRNPLKIRASLGLWTAWHSHVDSRFHCANIRHKREEKVAGPKLIHIKSLLAF